MIKNVLMVSLIHYTRSLSGSSPLKVDVQKAADKQSTKKSGETFSSLLSVSERQYDRTPLMASE